MTYSRHSQSDAGRIDVLQAQVSRLQAAASNTSGVTIVGGVAQIPRVATGAFTGTEFMSSGVPFINGVDDTVVWVPVTGSGVAGTAQVQIAPDGVTFSNLGGALTVPAGATIPVSLYLRAGMGVQVTCVNCTVSLLYSY